jgi:hypothetical protein
VPAFSDVRDAVARELARTRRNAAVEDLYQTLRERYNVDVQVTPRPARGGGS